MLGTQVFDFCSIGSPSLPRENFLHTGPKAPSPMVFKKKTVPCRGMGLRCLSAFSTHTPFDFTTIHCKIRHWSWGWVPKPRLQQIFNNIFFTDFNHVLWSHPSILLVAYYVDQFDMVVDSSNGCRVVSPFLQMAPSGAPDRTLTGILGMAHGPLASRPSSCAQAANHRVAGGHAKVTKTLPL